MLTLPHSTIERPRFVGRFARDHYREWLIADARYRCEEAAATPALDCADLAALMRIDPSAAYTALAELDLVQLTMQAACYAAHANALFDLNVTGEHVFSHWRERMDARGLIR